MGNAAAPQVSSQPVRWGGPQEGQIGVITGRCSDFAASSSRRSQATRAASPSLTESALASWTAVRVGCWEPPTLVARPTIGALTGTRSKPASWRRAAVVLATRMPSAGPHHLDYGELAGQFEELRPRQQPVGKRPTLGFLKQPLHQCRGAAVDHERRSRACHLCRLTRTVGSLAGWPVDAARTVGRQQAARRDQASPGRQGRVGATKGVINWPSSVSSMISPALTRSR